jgi:hypothetical protein
VSALRANETLHALIRVPWHVGTLARVAQPKRVRLQVERLFDWHAARHAVAASRAVRRLVGHATRAARQRASVVTPADNHVKATTMCSLPRGYGHKPVFVRRQVVA